jgi:hypothetical protein
MGRLWNDLLNGIAATPLERVIGLWSLGFTITLFLACMLGWAWQVCQSVWN